MSTDRHQISKGLVEARKSPGTISQSFGGADVHQSRSGGNQQGFQAPVQEKKEEEV
jgi:hypothetical protein